MTNELSGPFDWFGIPSLIKKFFKTSTTTPRIHGCKCPPSQNLYPGEIVF